MSVNLEAAVKDSIQHQMYDNALQYCLLKPLQEQPPSMLYQLALVYFLTGRHSDSLQVAKSILSRKSLAKSILSKTQLLYAQNCIKLRLRLDIQLSADSESSLEEATISTVQNGQRCQESIVKGRAMLLNDDQEIAVEQFKNALHLQWHNIEAFFKLIGLTVVVNVDKIIPETLTSVASSSSVIQRQITVRSARTNITTRSTTQLSQTSLLNDKKRTRSGASKLQVNKVLESFEQLSKSKVTSDDISSAELSVLYNMMLSSAAYNIGLVLQAYRLLSATSFGQSYQVMTTMAFHLSDMGKHVEARKLYNDIQSMYPYELDHIPRLCTVLWHLNDESEMAALAMGIMQQYASGNSKQGKFQQLGIFDTITDDRACAVALVAMGNLHSLHKDSELAIKAFELALKKSFNGQFASQVCTLIGHEHSICDNTALATKQYRAAIKHDHRAYIPWYHLARHYLKSDQLPDAEFCIKRAIEINNRNIMLKCFYASLLIKSDKMAMALLEYDKCMQVSRQKTLLKFGDGIVIHENPLPYYKKSSALMALGRYQDAIKLLQRCIQLAPNEAQLYLKLGKCYKQCGQKTMAMQAFVTAMSFNDQSRQPNRGQDIPREELESMFETQLNDGMIFD